MRWRSHGTGELDPSRLARLGSDVVFESGVLIFHPEHVEIGDDVYVGHGAILKGYHRNRLIIGPGTWIGPQCFLHAAGGITIGRDVGIGPQVKILTSRHAEEGIDKPILHAALELAPVVIEDDSDLGIGSIVMPGVRIGRGAQVGAGALVTRDVQAYGVVAGIPARLIRVRGEEPT